MNNTTFNQTGPYGIQVSGTVIQNGTRDGVAMHANAHATTLESVDVCNCQSFVSVATEETAIGGVIQSWISQLFPEAAPCFVAANTVQFGERWLEKIETALANSRIFCVVYGNLSFNRHWMHIEFGAAWVRRCPIIVLTHSGLRVRDLPIPYSTLQGGSLDDPTDIRKLLDAIAALLGRPPISLIDPAQLVQQVQAAKTR